jgi:hypothetical protein
MAQMEPDPDEVARTQDPIRANPGDLWHFGDPATRLRAAISVSEREI